MQNSDIKNSQESQRRWDREYQTRCICDHGSWTNPAYAHTGYTHVYTPESGWWDMRPSR